MSCRACGSSSHITEVERRPTQNPYCDTKIRQMPSEPAAPFQALHDFMMDATPRAWKRRLARVLRRLRQPFVGTSVEEYQLRMRRTFVSGEVFPTTQVPAGYALKFYDRGDEDEWLDVLNDSGEFGAWDFEMLQTLILQRLVRGGGIFVKKDGGIVACGAVTYSPLFAPFAELTYLVVLPEHRNRKLGTLVVQEVIRAALGSGYPGIMLHTQEYRTQAIAMYLKLGFLPDPQDSEGIQIWSRIRSAL
jgi:GNAT superfamily N-acetyltransferase